jgi:hypothetical protein
LYIHKPKRECFTMATTSSTLIALQPQQEDALAVHWLLSNMLLTSAAVDLPAGAMHRHGTMHHNH